MVESGALFLFLLQSSIAIPIEDCDLTPDDRKITPIRRAVFNNDVEELTHQLACGADPNATDPFGYESTLLHLATERVFEGIVKVLVNAGVNINAQDNYKRTALENAVRYNNNVDIIQLLLDSGADVHMRNEEGWNALHTAARYTKDAEVIQLLTDYGANVHEQSKYGWTALQYASNHNNNTEVIQALIDNGADVDHQSDEHGWSRAALHMAASYNTAGVVQTLIDNGANVNLQDLFGGTPLHHAAKRTKEEGVIKVLIQSGANLDIRNGKGWTPLDAATDKNGEIMKMLIDSVDQKEAEGDGAGSKNEE